MVNVRVRKDTGKLYFDFYNQNVRCREYSDLDDTKDNRRRMKGVANKIAAEITLGTFCYRSYFPISKRAKRFDPAEPKLSGAARIPTFANFAETWFGENVIGWRLATQQTIRSTLNRHLLPAFGEEVVSDITKPDVLAFRSTLAKVPGRNGNETLSAKTINHTMGVLGSILAEAADRFQFNNPTHNIKRLKQQRQDIQPFSLDEVRLILGRVRPDYRDYFTVRFFTGLRTGEVHGLKWSHIDFERRQILIRETFSRGQTQYTKTDGSQREVAMSQPVFEALQRQAAGTRERSPYVFCTRTGSPLDTKNVTDRVWYPLLRHLGLVRRRPYQCRHTAATLWLAAGENPEWIARQLGHVSTEMLFRVYSRFVPNLTRQDGSAFDRLIQQGLAPIAVGGSSND